MDNCNAVNTATVDKILAEMKNRKECDDTDCITVGAAVRGKGTLVFALATSLLALGLSRQH
jgi:hypothetical protein